MCSSDLVKNPDSPDYVHRALVRSRCLQHPGEPLLTMKLWTEYYNNLTSAEQAKQLSVINEIMVSGQEFVESSNVRLQEELDPAKRESLVQDRDNALTIMASFRKQSGN